MNTITNIFPSYEDALEFTRRDCAVNSKIYAELEGFDETKEVINNLSLNLLADLKEADIEQKKIMTAKHRREVYNLMLESGIARKVTKEAVAKVLPLWLSDNQAEALFKVRENPEFVNSVVWIDDEAESFKAVCEYLDKELVKHGIMELFNDYSRELLKADMDEIIG